MAWHSDPYISGHVTATVLNWQETEEGQDILVGGGSEDKVSACQFQSLGWEDPLEKEIATHSSILAWRIP